MNTKRIAVAALIIMLLAGCSGGKYVKEKTLLTTVTRAMESFTSSMATADTPEAVAGYLTTFTGQLEEVLPKMKELTTTHPKWENNPPRELQAELDKFKSASSEFQSVAVPKAMQFARDHADNPALQSALEKFSNLISQL